MKAIVVAAKVRGRWIWSASTAIHADLVIQLQRTGAREGIWLLEPDLSYGQAVTEAAALNGRRIVPSHTSVLPLLNGRKVKLRTPTNVEWNAAGHKLLAMDELKSLCSAFEGRSLLPEELQRMAEHFEWAEVKNNLFIYVRIAELLGRLRLETSIREVKAGIVSKVLGKSRHACVRCGSSGRSIRYTECASCGDACPYCEACLTMGRARWCTPLIRGCTSMASRKPVSAAHGGANDIDSSLTSWGLSEVQAEASRAALLFLESRLHAKSSPECFLLWAVTGAGKTEMMFPMIHYMLSRDRRVLVTTPRKDVVIELEPRLKKAFPSVQVATLYGGSQDRWISGQLTIATTHQLMRFSEAFDLVIIDEIDAFPYHNNPMLEYAAKRVLAPGGTYLFLSATPPYHLQQAVRRNYVQCAKIPSRYHRHPLPVPKILLTPTLSKIIAANRLPGSLYAALTRAVLRSAQLFVFVPRIDLVDRTVGLLQQTFPAIRVAGTSSVDKERANKVQLFRQKEIRILVTTTILERGVTIPKSDVFILDGDAPIFDTASLIQMAGRAGRSKDDPCGAVFFTGKERTRAQVHAIKQIKEMNAIAYKKGYIDYKENINKE